MRKKSTPHLSKNQKFIWIAIVALILFTIFTAPFFRNEVNKNVVAHTSTLRDDLKLSLPRGEIYVQLANTPNTQELGLSYRDSIGDDEGMLFVFDKPDNYAFWMKDMKFPIDMVWFSEAGQVVHYEENVAPDSYPKVFVNKPKAKYVLEVNAGNAAKYGLYLGAKVELSKVKN
jgi:uncharacterized membrane protein (UPF0127 family)